MHAESKQQVQTQQHSQPEKQALKEQSHHLSLSNNARNILCRRSRRLKRLRLFRCTGLLCLVELVDLAGEIP